MADRLGLHQGLAIFLFHKGAFPRIPKPICNHVHGLFEIEGFPLSRKWPAVLYLQFASRMCDQFKTVCTFWAQMTARNGRLRIALDANELAVFMKGKLPASHTAIRTDGASYFRAL